MMDNVIQQQISQALSYGNVLLFRSLVQPYRAKINGFIVYDPESGSRMNILHLLADCIPESKDLPLIIKERYFEFVQVLYGCEDFNVDARAVKERVSNVTAAHIAVQRRNKEMLSVLIEYGCDLLICDSYGLNVEDYAIREQDPSLIEMVKKGIFSAIEKQVKNPILVASLPRPTKRYLSISSESSDFYPFEKLTTSPESDKDTVEDGFSNASLKSHLSTICVVNESSFSSAWEPKMLTQLSEDDENEAQPDSEVSLETVTTTVYHEDGVELIEEKSRPKIQSSLEASLNSSFESDPNDSHESNESIDSLILHLSDEQLFEKLNDCGFEPGPINDGTRKYYQRKYHLIRRKGKTEEKPSTKMSNYNIPFDLISNRSFPFKKAVQMESVLVKMFQRCDPDEKQTHFVYLLLDPCITESISVGINHNHEPTSVVDLLGDVLNDANLFYRFVEAIFYVGKGQSNRPYHHLVEAIKARKNQKPGSVVPAKTQRIWSIWDQGRGPVSLHFFLGITADEAYTREALLIDTLLLFNLTNQIAGSYRRTLPFNLRDKNILGTYLLFKFFIVYLLNGERQIKIPQ